MLIGAYVLESMRVEPFHRVYKGSSMLYSE